MKFLFLCVALCCLYHATQQSPTTPPRLSPEALKPRIISLLDKANAWMRQDTKSMILREISRLVSRIEAPVVQNSPLVTEVEKRALEKIFLCRSIMAYLKDKIPPPSDSSCKRCVQYPDTKRLLVMLGEMDEVVSRQMDDLIAGILVRTAVGLQCMPREGKDWMEYKVNLDISIGRLNLKWD